jgi:hypothetical protein
VENIIEVLLSLRVHALQISPELRRHLVNELIKADIFFITNGAPSIGKKQGWNPASGEPKDKFLLDLLDMQSGGLRHAICALISVIASTSKGVDYLC